METPSALVVDDDVDVARHVATFLRRLAYEVHVAHDVAGALAVVRAHKLAVAVLDLDLGCGTTSQPIAHELYARNVPILILTGQDEPSLPEIPASAPLAFLTKPASFAAISTTIELLRKHAHALAEIKNTQFLLNESQRLASIGSYRLDYETGEITWTEETYRIYGLSPATYTPSAATFMDLIHPDDRQFVATMMAPAARSLGLPHIDYRIVRADGVVRKVRGSADHSINSLTGTHIVGSIQDITDLERATQDLADTEQRAQVANAANRAKTEFLAHMSHELRTPLNAVLGLSEAMLERVFGEINPRQVQTLETIYRSGKHLLDLINDVLDIARVESGKIALDVEQTALGPVVEESIALVGSMLTERGQRVVLELAPGLPPVDLDKRRMRQALLNLLGNASKFSPTGSTVTVRVAADPRRREATIAVIDRGIGIAPENRARIFEPFVAVESVKTRSYDGAGLGLALSKRFVELHQGTLTVESELGAGSTFTIALPVSASYIEPPPEAVRAHPPRQRRVLLVEDNEATVLAVRAYLESRGFDVSVVGDGGAALEAAAAHDIRLVLMDLQLPTMNGLEVARLLRARGVRKPIIALTAHAMPDDERRCLEAGATAYLAKPVRLRHLAETIDRLLLEHT